MVLHAIAGCQARPNRIPDVPPSRSTALGHDCAENAVDAGRVTLPELLEPIVHVAIYSSRHQDLGSPTKLRELFISQLRDVRVVNTGIVACSLALSDPSQD